MKAAQNSQKVQYASSKKEGERKPTSKRVLKNNYQDLETLSQLQEAKYL